MVFPWVLETDRFERGAVENISPSDAEVLGSGMTRSMSENVGGTASKRRPHSAESQVGAGDADALGGWTTC